jgi:hypothetical protein
VDAGGGAVGRIGTLGCGMESEPDWSQLWAESGAAILSGRSDGPALDVPIGLVVAAVGTADRIARASAALEHEVRLDGPALLGERAALNGFSRQGDVSCGGATRLVRTVDGWLAVSLARESDLDLLPAWLDGTPMPAERDDVWPALEFELRGRATAWLMSRAAELGLPVGALGETMRTTIPAIQLEGEPTTKPMDDRIVVDLSSLWAGPLCAHVLGLAGARVVKVESVSRPDGARLGSPEFYDLLHAGHDSVALDFTDDGDRRRLRALLERADVVIEASRPRALAHLGIDPQTLQGPAVWVSITAHGRAANRVGFGDDAAIAGGLVTWDDRDPCFCVDAVADPLTGLEAAAGALEQLAIGGRWLLDLSLSAVAAKATSEARTNLDGLPMAPPRARTPVGVAPAMGTHTDSVLADLLR